MRDKYRKQVALLIRIMPAVYSIKEFAVHGGTAINLFYNNMPRYSVDIDLTYIPVQDREQSIAAINARLLVIKQLTEKSIPGITVIHKPEVLKLLCTLRQATVKIEVNGTKRGIIGETVDLPLCEKAREQFNMACKARTVSFSQLYGGKIAAALGRQHPRDLFDCAHMRLTSFDDVRDGLLLCLLGSDKPIVESLKPNDIDQREALENQFEGMSDMPFSYEDYKATKAELLKLISDNMTDDDRQLLLSFEKGNPDWSECRVGDLSAFPSVSWKLLNIEKLKRDNPKKHEREVKRLSDFFYSLQS